MININVINIITWIAVPVNAFMICYLDDSIRDYIFIPRTAGEQCFNTTDVDYQTPFARWYGYNTSWRADCAENYRMCFAEVGGVEWLPGVEYLFPDSTTTLDFTEFGMCNPRNKLFNENFCHFCRERVAKVRRVA